MGTPRQLGNIDPLNKDCSVFPMEAHRQERDGEMKRKRKRVFRVHHHDAYPSVELKLNAKERYPTPVDPFF